MARQITQRRLTKKKSPPPRGAELKEVSNLTAQSAMISIDAALLKLVSAELQATSNLELTINSLIRVSATLNAKSELTAAAVPFKAGKFVANATSKILHLQLKISKLASAKLESKSTLNAKSVKVSKAPPIKMNALSRIVKCNAVIPPMVEGILIIGNPNSFGIDV